MNTLVLLPRFIRQKDAPGYLGVDRNKFDDEWRPKLTEIPLGKRGIGYDRLDLDVLADEYKEAHGRPGRKPKGDKKCELGQKESSLPMTVAGSSTKSTVGKGSSSGSARSAKTKQKLGLEVAKPASTPSRPTAFDAAMTACGQTLRGST